MRDILRGRKKNSVELEKMVSKRNSGCNEGKRKDGLLIKVEKAF